MYKCSEDSDTLANFILTVFLFWHTAFCTSFGHCILSHYRVDGRSSICPKPLNYQGPYIRRSNKNCVGLDFEKNSRYDISLQLTNGCVHSLIALSLESLKDTL